MNPTDLDRDTQARTAAVMPSEEKLSPPPEAETLSVGTPSTPLFGVLPVARLIPQDIHSVVDYATALTCVTSALVAEATSARVVGLVHAGLVGGLSVMTDYRLSLAKIVPIEVHELGDYVTGLLNITAPFMFGYWKKSPLSSLLQIGSGALAIMSSLVTDYRAARGVKWPRINAALSA